MVLFTLLRASKNHFKKAPYYSWQSTEDYWSLSFYSRNLEGKWLIYIYIFVKWNEKFNTMCYCLLNYDDNIILDMFYIKMSCIIVFLTNTKSVISWDFLSQFFEAVKELHKLWLLIPINITNLHFLFVGHQVRKNICQFHQQ